MSSIRVLDVLVVYSSGVAMSASSHSLRSTTPFGGANLSSEYNEPYAYLLDMCKKRGLSAGFATTNDVIGPGLVRSYWMHNSSGWVKIRSRGYAQTIFDKCSPHSSAKKKAREILFSSSSITPFNENELYDLFFDKLSLYDSIGNNTIPTVSLEDGDKESVKRATDYLSMLLKLHSYSDDFASDYVLKDRFGSAGNHVYQIANQEIDGISTIINSNPTISFVLQPMLLFDAGYKYKKNRGKFEIRLIISNERVIQTYLRTPDIRGTLCNGHQGGRIIYTKVKDVPKIVQQAAKVIMTKLPEHSSLYALDFVVSNNGNAYLLEGNTGPGLNWDPNNKSDVIGTKKLIKAIAAELVRKVANNKAQRVPARQGLPGFGIISVN